MSNVWVYMELCVGSRYKVYTRFILTKSVKVSDVMEGGGGGYTLSVIMTLSVHFSVWR